LISSHPNKDTTLVTIVVCRDCCCGTERKHPGFDHSDQLVRIQQAALVAGATVRVSTCLDECDHSNVVVVRKRLSARESIWFGDVIETEKTEIISDWVRTGCNGPVPLALSDSVFTPKKQLQH